MRIRALATLALCFSVLAGSSLGLNSGVVLCVDHHGHVALEAAHVRHAHLHEEGADHGPHEFPADADHAALHAALPGCVDTALSAAGDRSLSSKLPRLSGLFLLAWPNAAACGSMPGHAGILPGSGSSMIGGAAPPSHLACLRAVVLTV